MSTTASRRQFLAAGLALAAGPVRAARAEITVGITSNTQPDWGDDFLLSIREASEVGYHWIETFWPYVERWADEPKVLIDLMAELDLKMETVSNGGRMNTFFQRPDQRKAVIAEHLRLVQFIQKLGCDHLKINCGEPNPGGNTPEIYREMSKTFNELGKQSSDLGIRFGIHHHLWTQYETRRDIDAIMELTDPKYVHMVLDTGHTTMAGMDPVQLAKDYDARIIEFHCKDAAPENRGGYTGLAMERGSVNTGPHDRIFELGRGGVDFPAIQAHMNSIGWKGWFTVELDRTGTTAKDSARVSKQYLEEVLGLKV